MTIKPDQLSPWQSQAMTVPESIDLFLGGGRGGGKSRFLAALFLRHCEQHKDRARCLVVRRSFPGLQDLESEFRSFFYDVYGNTAKYDQQKHLFTLPNGATIRMDQMEREADFLKFQGKSFSHIAVDEAGQWSTPALIDRLRSSLRAPEGIPTRFILLANPGGTGHAWLAQRYALQQPWLPYTCSATNTEFVTVRSTYRDNPFIDRDKYERQLMASCATDPELAKAWLDGDWSVIRGAFFAGVLDENRVRVEPWQFIPQGWGAYLAHDFGVAAPSVTYLCAESQGGEGPDGCYYPRGSIILVDEFASVLEDDLNRGLGMTVPELAQRIVDMCDRWGVRANGVADDAIFNRTGSQSGSISNEFRRSGVHFRRAHKGSRQSGWEIMRRLLSDAGSIDKPGLYVSRHCRYWWLTVPTLPRDPRHPEDLDSTAPDHAADACRYALTHKKPILNVPIKFLY